MRLTVNVNILLSLLGCATQAMTDDTLMHMLIPISFPLEKTQTNMFWCVRGVLHAKQESEAIECRGAQSCSKNDVLPPKPSCDIRIQKLPHQPK